MNDASDLVVIRIYPNRIEAELARGALEAAEIDSMITADDMGGNRPALWVAEGVKLRVRAEDARRAEQILGPRM